MHPKEMATLKESDREKNKDSKEAMSKLFKLTKSYP